MNRWIASVEAVATYKNDPDAWVSYTLNPSDRRAEHRRMLWSEKMLGECQQYVDRHPEAAHNVLRFKEHVSESDTLYSDGADYLQYVGGANEYGVRLHRHGLVQLEDKLLAAQYGVDLFVIVVRGGRVVAAINDGAAFLHYKIPHGIANHALRKRATDRYLQQKLPQIRKEIGLKSPE